MSEKTLILTEDRILKIIKRIAYQIVEGNYKFKTVYLIGISGQGEKLAGLLAEEISAIRSEIVCKVETLSINKEKPKFSEIAISCELSDLNDRSVVVVDDVMNTGRTHSYALSYILQTAVKKVETAVLVNRSHKAFPISATYSGISLSTTIDEHIEVELNKETAAYLF